MTAVDILEELQKTDMFPQNFYSWNLANCHPAVQGEVERRMSSYSLGLDEEDESEKDSLYGVPTYDYVHAALNCLVSKIKDSTSSLFLTGSRAIIYTEEINTTSDIDVVCLAESEEHKYILDLLEKYNFKQMATIGTESRAASEVSDYYEHPSTKIHFNLVVLDTTSQYDDWLFATKSMAASFAATKSPLFHNKVLRNLLFENMVSWSKQGKRI